MSALEKKSICLISNKSRFIPAFWPPPKLTLTSCPVACPSSLTEALIECRRGRTHPLSLTRGWSDTSSWRRRLPAEDHRYSWVGLLEVMGEKLWSSAFLLIVSSVPRVQERPKSKSRLFVCCWWPWQCTWWGRASHSENNHEVKKTRIFSCLDFAKISVPHPASNIQYQPLVHTEKSIFLHLQMFWLSSKSDLFCNNFANVW